jgi:hypothetical protein
MMDDGLVLRDDGSAVWTPAELAALLLVDRVTIERKVRSGDIARVPHLRVVRIPHSEVVRLLAGVYDGSSDGSREGRRNDRPDHDARGATAVPRCRDDGGWAADLEAGEDAKMTPAGQSGPS